MTQNEAILQFLKGGNSITPIEALNKFGCFRLSGRIYDLRKEGYNILEKTVRNNGKHFSEYRLESKIESNGQILLV